METSYEKDFWSHFPALRVLKCTCPLEKGALYNISVDSEPCVLSKFVLRLFSKSLLRVNENSISNLDLLKLCFNEKDSERKTQRERSDFCSALAYRNTGNRNWDLKVPGMKVFCITILPPQT